MIVMFFHFSNIKVYIIYYYNIFKITYHYVIPNYHIVSFPLSMESGNETIYQSNDPLIIRMPVLIHFSKYHNITVYFQYIINILLSPNNQIPNMNVKHYGTMSSHTLNNMGTLSDYKST